jgi:hypothetical protein
MNLIYNVFCLLALPTSLMAQSPVRETLAYSRKTIPGIPGNDSGALPSQDPFPTSYFIYVVVKRGTVISVSGVCLQGKRYDATLHSVDAPVLSEHDVSVPTGKKDTLVQQTSDDVYRVEIGDRKGPCDKNRSEGKLARRYEVVVCLKSGGSSWYGLVTRIVPLLPAAAM